MRLALAVVAFLIAYGSLYPFDVNMGAPVDWRAFATTLGTDLSRADLLANVILFVPLGFFAAAGWRAGSGGAYAWSWTKALVVVALSLVFAAALQVLQLYLPSRDPNLQDACWNLLGTLLGMALARLLMARTFAMTPGVGRGSTEHYWVTAGLAVSWAAYRLSPFVPSFDVQSLKDGLKPLTAVLLSGRPADAITSGYAGGFELYRDVVLWSAFTWLAVHSFVRPPRDVHLLWLVPALFAAELMVVDNVLFPSDVLGAVLALVLWFAWFRRSAGDVSILVLALLSVIVVDGLSPFELRGEIGPFNW
ncbi:MAG: VanZ family protein, partial [Gammaproteobacteria bacterium]